MNPDDLEIKLTEMKERICVLESAFAAMAKERDKFQGMARASESALTAVSWPLVRFDRTGDSPDVIAERLVARLAAAEKERDELQATITACEEEVSKAYWHITGGKFSKMNTRAEVIIDEYEAAIAKCTSSP